MPTTYVVWNLAPKGLRLNVSAKITAKGLNESGFVYRIHVYQMEESNETPTQIP